MIIWSVLMVEGPAWINSESTVIFSQPGEHKKVHLTFLHDSSYGSLVCFFELYWKGRGEKQNVQYI